MFNAYAKIADMLQRATSPPSPVLPPPTPPPASTQRVLERPTPAVASQRVPVMLRAKASSLPKQLPLSKPSDSSRLSTHRQVSPRFRHPQPAHLQFAQSLQHDPSVAGKMFHPATGRPETIDTLLRGPDKVTWTTSLANERARCAQGLTMNRPADRHIIGNQTIFFISPRQVPAGRKVTHANFVCTMRPGKAEPCRIRLTGRVARPDVTRISGSP